MLRSLMGMRSAVRLTTQLSTFSTLTPRNVKLAEGILQGNRTSLARAITLVESQLL